MWREFSFNGKYKWIDMYKQLINKYNNRVHITIKMSPTKVNSTNDKQILQKSYNHLKIFVASKFRKGGHVRISKYKHVFEKGYTPNYTTEIFKIRKVKNTYPETSLLDDLDGSPIQGGFYKEELKKTRFPHTYLVEKVVRRKANKVLVKWLGFSKTGWINKKDIL